MMRHVTTESSLSVWPRLTVSFMGGRDEIVSGPTWGWRSRHLGLTYQIAATRDTDARRLAVGTLNLRQPLLEAIDRFNPPSHITISIKQSPATRLGLNSRTLSVIFSTTSPWDKPIPTGRQLWAAMPMDIRCLQRVIHGVAEAHIGRFSEPISHGSGTASSRGSDAPARIAPSA